MFIACFCLDIENAEVAEGAKDAELISFTQSNWILLWFLVLLEQGVF